MFRVVGLPTILVAIFASGVGLAATDTISPITWDDFSGNETWIRFGPPTFYLVQSFTADGMTVRNIHDDGWLQTRDQLAFLFSNIPGASGDPAAKTTGTLVTHLQVDFSVPVNRFGLLLSSGSVATWELTAFDDELSPMGTITALMPGSCQATFAAFESTQNIARVEIFEPVHNGQNDAFDDIRFEPIPEPSTLLLLSVGAVGLLAYAWRQWRGA